MIQLVGPGGAGKTTVGRALAMRLGVAFADLDERFRQTRGDISAFLDAEGYMAYCAQNVQAYVEVVRDAPRDGVLALSSGFLTYASGAHPEYQAVSQAIISSPLTVVLLPSFDRETCVAETVRRQLTRPFARSAEREDEVIRSRFELYRGLPCLQVETGTGVHAVVEQIVVHVLPNLRLQPTAAGAIMGRRG